jgi:hypothetical protein
MLQTVMNCHRQLYICCKIEISENIGFVNSKRTQPHAIDSKREYSKALLFHGLVHMIMKDAVRENDGHRMVTHWKFLLPYLQVFTHAKVTLNSERFDAV